MSDYAALRDHALTACRLGGAVALDYFTQQAAIDVDWKADASPVTIADRACEQRIRDYLAAHRAADAVLGEEDGLQGDPDAAWQWIVDPIDGTKNFIHGIPLWATLVACRCQHGPDAGQIVASAVGIPALDEWYEAFRGGEARLNGQSLAVSTIPTLDEALFAMNRRHGSNGMAYCQYFST